MLVVVKNVKNAMTQQTRQSLGFFSPLSTKVTFVRFSSATVSHPKVGIIGLRRVLRL